MSILSGYKKFKRYVLTDNGYQLCSQWTSSNTVHFDDGNTAQTKVGAINGITDSLTATSSNVALSAAAGKNLQDQVTQLNTGLEWKSVSGVTGNNLLTLPTADWHECIVTFRLHSKTGATMSYYMVNRNIDTRNFVTGYLSNEAINEAGHGGSPRLLWVRFYNHSQNFRMMEANPEDGVINYRMDVLYR